jgi:probable phosphoglycerate mutase
MQVLAKEARDLLAGTTVTFEWIPREENSRADAAANKALDAKQSYVER